MGRAEPWEVAARLEEAAFAIRDASKALDAAYSAALCFRMSAATEMSEIPDLDKVDRGMADALQALSDKMQAIADAEQEDPEPGSNEWLMRSPQFHPGDLA